MTVTVIINQRYNQRLSTQKVAALLNMLKSKKVNYSSRGAEFALMGDIKTIYRLEEPIKELYLLIALWEKVKSHHVEDNGDLHLELNTLVQWVAADVTLLNKLTKELS